ncbi:MAG: sigma-54-dependent Fis family transcriptional regulator [Proteobacteria bacterium]|nr:sigma-54-dependent Fis family transcriptional regulator [Pseudomonadota bacterium]
MLIDVLIVDDESDIRELISDILKDEGYAPRTAKNSVEAFDAIKSRVPTAIILDIWLKDSPLDGLGILESVKRKYPHVPIIMISGHGTIETAITSIKMGAYDYIEKPFKEDKLLHLLQRAIETARLKIENKELKTRVAPPAELVGKSATITQLKQAVERVAPTGSRVFVTGPAGTGKEVIARLIHQKSQRRKGPFVVLTAASMVENLVDTELFGTEEDDSINGPPRKIGIFERAAGGTLFIDEISDMPLSTQAKLLRVLQDNSLTRIGGKQPIEVDVRVIAASNSNIQDLIKTGKFREDLYYRLNVVPLKAPSLSERREDIPLLTEYFIKACAEANGTQACVLSEDAIAAMQVYDWPGNVRQLKNVIEWLMIMSATNSDPITSSMLPKEILSSGPAALGPEVNPEIMAMPLREARELFERQYLIAQINRFGGNISRTSEFVEMERSALHRKLKLLNIGNYEAKEATKTTTSSS